MASNNVYRALRITNSVSAFCAFNPVSIRSFTCSAAFMKHGAVPAFKPSSSPELDDLLAIVRRKVFLPYHLSKKERNLIFKDTKSTGIDLEKEPQWVSIEGERFRLEHVDVTKDVPRHWTVILQTLEACKTKEDYENLTTLLIGLKETGYELKAKRSIKLIARLAKAKRLDLVLELARRESATGFGFSDIATTNMWLKTIQRQAIRADWKPEPTKQGLVWLEMFNDLSQEPTRKWTVRPEIIYSVLLEFAATQVTNHALEDTEGKIRTYAEKLLAAHPSTQDLDSIRNLKNSSCNELLEEYVTMLHACKLALPILSTNASIAKPLEAKISELEVAVEHLMKPLKEEREGFTWDGVELHQTLLGSSTS
ncbi:hypothetical protein PVAG01_04785 [Phlyctema vagabunda]|uniref:Uncharacterized protein n=1 Tax=Phlyctema vagabunda TaxID=108571 RepID=A0ABR4PIA1_9HELO